MILLLDYQQTALGVMICAGRVECGSRTCHRNDRRICPAHSGVFAW
jgi:hypothetical protein